MNVDRHKAAAADPQRRHNRMVLAHASLRVAFYGAEQPWLRRLCAMKMAEASSEIQRIKEHF